MTVVEQEPVVEPLADPFDVPVDPVSEILWGAADLLERVGWCQHIGLNSRGQRCVLNAISTVNMRRPAPVSGFQAANRLCRFLGLGQAGTNLPAWNDKPERTKKEVIAALRGAAEKIR